MNISAINGLSNVDTYKSAVNNTSDNTNLGAFESLLQSAMSMVNETNSLTNDANEASLNFALGKTDSTHDVMIAQQKANTALQYTVAVRNAVLDAYKEIMQLQF